MANYNGLTRNQWPGTWSPNANHPIVLDTEIRGGLRYVSGDSGDKVSDITGQRLQDGMLIYIKTAHDGYEAEKYYRYQVLPGESRDSNTGELPNASGNWEIMRFPIDSATATDLIDSAYIKGIADSDYIKTVTGIDADTLDGQEGSYYRNYNNLTNKPLILDNVDVSNIIVNDVDKAFVDALNVDADTLDNLNSTQFLRSDQSDSMVGSLTIDSNLTVGGYIAGPANMIIDPARVGTDSGTVQILGNLQVEGTTTTINSTTVSINDKNIILADSAANAAAADGAGITIAGANATLQYSASGDKFVFNKSFEGDWLGFDADFALKSTSDLSEGTNLYYTTARADSDFDVRLATKTTTDVAEGTNLYYTKARVDSDISSAFDDSSTAVNVTINNFIEDKVDSAYVLARVNEAPFLDSANAIALIDSAYIQARQLNFDELLDSAEVIDLVDSAYVQARIGTTTNLPEGTNLYYTKARVDSDISNLIDSAYINARTEAGTDSATVIALIDSAYVQARQVDLQRDSGFVTNIVDSAYVAARAGDAGTDSSTVVAIIDSHVDATFINNLVIDADTLGGNDSTYYLDYNNFTNTPTIPTVDKPTIDALNIDADTLDGQQGTYYLNYQNFTNTPNVLDSSEVTNIFADNLTTEGLRGVESIEFVHDSDYTTFTVAVDTKTNAHRYHGTGSTNGYVIRGVESPFFQLVPGNIYRFDMSNGTNAGHPLLFYYDAAKTTQYTSGVTTSGIAGQANAYVEIMIDDNTPSVLHYQCGNHGYMGNAIFVQTRNLTGFDTDDLSEGSSNLYYTDARVTSHVDSAYVALRQNYAWSSLTGVPKLIDSALVTQLIDSAYIAARESGTGTGAGGLDSDAIFAIIDSAYIQAREAVSGSGANVAFKTISISGSR